MRTDISKLLDKVISKEPDQYPDERYRSHWRGSNMGRCYRYQYWYRQGVKMTNAPDAKVLRTFRVGNLFHRDLQSLLPEATTEVNVVVDDVALHVDYLADDYVEDFKTVGDFQWRIISGKNYDVVGDKIQYIYQLMTYVRVCDKKYGILTFIRKDTYEMKSFTFMLEDWVELVDFDLTKLRSFWDRQQLPPAVPRAYGYKECKYCSFCDKCDKAESNTADDRRKAIIPFEEEIF